MSLITVKEISVIMGVSYPMACKYIKKNENFPKNKGKKVFNRRSYTVFDEDEVRQHLISVDYTPAKREELKPDNRKYIPERYGIKTPERKYPAEFSPIELMRLKQWGVKHELVC